MSALIKKKLHRLVLLTCQVGKGVVAVTGWPYVTPRRVFHPVEAEEEEQSLAGLGEGDGVVLVLEEAGEVQVPRGLASLPGADGPWGRRSARPPRWAVAPLCSVSLSQPVSDMGRNLLPSTWISFL